MSDPEHDPMHDDVDQLATKVAKVMQSIDHVPKNGYNDFHKYEYSTDDDVMQSVRPAMAEHNLIALPSVVDRQIEGVETKNGTTLHTRVTIEITLIDGDSGQSKMMLWEGEAQDGQDKGLYKAYTSGIKYWALKTFLLSADADVETHDAAASKPQTRRKSPRQNGQGSGGREEPEEYMTDISIPGAFWDSYDKDQGESMADADFSILDDTLAEEGYKLAEEAEAGVTKNDDGAWRISIEGPFQNSEANRVDRYGEMVLPKYADAIDKRDKALKGKGASDLADPIEAIQNEINDWPGRPGRAANNMLDHHRDRLNDFLDQQAEGSGSDGAPEDSSRLPTSFPTGFPKAQKLKQNGFTSPDDLDDFMESGGDLTSIKGIGEATEQDIQNAMDELKEEWSQETFEPDDDLPF